MTERRWPDLEAMRREVESQGPRFQRASGEPAARATERLLAFAPVVGHTSDGTPVHGVGCTVGPMSFPDSDEPPTSPINNGVLMTMPQAREALQSIPPDLQPLVWAIARGFWDDGFGVGAAHLPRTPPDRSPEGVNTLAPLGKRRGKR